ncbi:AI-2E family transporter [Pseudoxanthomonas suwonensis]|uniref:AI-2E family transporter n=1 Tax=Pseudoxanthomonas suwonensis TaxID=314722 RepID=UPI00049081E7|nr:AI-2E family transporter [Pseudoxanthomonas suwonensis]
MNERFRAVVHGTVFAVLVGWVLYVARDILVPVAFGVMALYVVLGSARLLAKVPVLGPAAPEWLRLTLATLVIAGALVLLVGVATDSVDRLLQRVPQYQAQLVALVQQGAAVLGIESEPSWDSIRQAVMAQVNLQRLAGSTLGLAASLVGTLVVVVVALYVAFLLVERRHFDAKIGQLAPEPERAARIRHVVADINRRIGTYLALKTLLGVLLGLASWIILAAMGVELAPFWALLVGLIDYVPYVGSILGVALPALFALLQFGDLKTALVLTGALSLVQFLNGHLLDPYLMGSSLNLSPFVILVSLTVWTALWGLPGAFLAVPLTASIVMVLAQFAGSRPIAVLLSKKGEV